MRPIRFFLILEGGMVEAISREALSFWAGVVCTGSWGCS